MDIHISYCVFQCNGEPVRIEKPGEVRITSNTCHIDDFVFYGGDISECVQKALQFSISRLEQAQDQ